MEHKFNVEVAQKYGIEEAILLENIFWWCEKNRANNAHIHDDKAWTYNSARAFSELFPYMSQSKIRRALIHLEEEGLIEIGNFNKDTHDRTQWYTVTKLTNAFYKMKNGILQNEECIYTDNKPDNKHVHSVHSSPSPDGEVDSFSTLTKGGFAEVLDSFSVSGKKREAVLEFIKMRKLIKKPMTPHALELALKNLNKLSSDEGTQIAILEQSIANSWQGLFPLRNESHSAPVEEFDYEDLPKSFRKIYEQQGLHWKASLPRICRSVTDLQFWYKAKREDEKFTKKNLGTSWDGFRFSAQSFWDSFLSYISDVIGDKQPQPAFFDPNGNMLNSWAREMEIEL